MLAKCELNRQLARRYFLYLHFLDGYITIQRRFSLLFLLTRNKKVSLESLYGIYLFLPVEDMVTKHIITFPRLDSDLLIEPASCK